MIKARVTGKLLLAPDGFWFHPDDPHEEPFQLLGKDGRPLSPENEKQYYTGHNTEERAERVLADPTPEEEQRIADLLQELGIEDLEILVEDCELSPDDARVTRGVALMFVRGALDESWRTNIFQLMSGPGDCWLEALVPNPEERVAVEVLCERMDLPTEDPMCRSMALAYWVQIFNDEQWELVAHLLRKVKGAASEATPRQ